MFSFVLALAFLLQDPTPSAAGTAAVQATPVQSTGTLVFYRPRRYWGSALTPSVMVNGADTARLDNGRFFVVTLPAGKVKIESSMKHDPLEVELAPGKVQYFEMVILAGTWKGGGRLIPTAEADAKEAVKKLKALDKKWVVSDKVSLTLPETAGN